MQIEKLRWALVQDYQNFPLKEDNLSIKDNTAEFILSVSGKAQDGPTFKVHVSVLCTCTTMHIKQCK